MALARATETAILAGDHDRAGQALEELLDVLLDLGTRRWAADGLEMAAVVLERRGDRAGAMSALEAATALRAASDERGGGVRAVAGEVRRSARRLRSALEVDRLPPHEGGPRSATPEAAMLQVLAALRSREPGRSG
jgi:hypothetical protein